MEYEQLSNPSQRRAYLRDLVASLSHWDVRELSEQLSRVDLRKDIIAHLPVELRVLVASHLDGQDIISLLNVSKQWRQIWLQEDVLRQLADRHLPGFLPYFGLKEQVTPTKQDLPQLFLDAVRKLRIRKRGMFRSVLVGAKDQYGGIFKLDPSCQPDVEQCRGRYDGLLSSHCLERTATLRYYGGRLAYHPAFGDRRLVAVDDLRTRVRKVYRLPGLLHDLQASEIVALGDKLVVVRAGRSMLVPCSTDCSLQLES